MKSYGNPPKLLEHFQLKPKEVLYYLYLPISLAGRGHVALPQQLEVFRPLVDAAYLDEPRRFLHENVYITAKRMFVGGGVTPNRPGWHADGFLTSDLNYVWYDCVPTIFNTSDFNITPDHLKSLQEFDAQADPANDITYPTGQLLKLDSTVVHRVGDVDKQVMRTFVKISISPEKYNLSDNSHNYDLEYNWEMHDRATVRNDPHRAQKDSASSPDDHFV